MNNMIAKVYINNKFVVIIQYENLTLIACKLNHLSN